MDAEAWFDGLELAGAVFGGLIVVLLPLEAWYLWRGGQLRWPRIAEMLASASPVVPTLLTAGLVTTFVGTLFTAAARLAPVQLPVTGWSTLLVVLLVDFLYYWDHRVAHRNRTYWALAHSVHHSSPQFDQTTGLRVSFIDGFISPWFYVPAVLAGFHPLQVAGALGLVIGWQQWIHTTAIGALPALDGWLNTPANHRVHHGVQSAYQDRNYGAVLMLWDRLFGTYAAELEPVRFGITHPIDSVNPVVVHTREALRLWRDLRAAPTVRARLRLLWMPPGWSGGSRSALTGAN